MKCKFCGSDLPEGTKFCSACGAKIEEQDAPVVGEVVNNQNSATPNTKRPIKGGMLAWSIVNTALGTSGCCCIAPFVSLVLGIIAIVFTILARDAATDTDEAGKLKIAKILNIIATCITALSLLITLVFVILMTVGVIGSIGGGGIPSPDEFMQMYPYLK